MSPESTGSLSRGFSLLRAGRFSDLYRGLCERIPSDLHCRKEALVFELEPSGQVASTALPEQCNFRALDREEVMRLPYLTGASQEAYDRRLAAGDTCYGLLQADEPMTVLWVHRGSCFVRGLGFLHAGGISDAYLYWIYTVPACRQRGFYRLSLHKVCEALTAQGFRRITQLVEAGNVPVLKTLPRLGYVNTKTVIHRRLLGLKTTLVVDLQNGTFRRKCYFLLPKTPARL